MDNFSDFLQSVLFCTYICKNTEKKEFCTEKKMYAYQQKRCDKEKGREYGSALSFISVIFGNLGKRHPCKITMKSQHCINF